MTAQRIVARSNARTAEEMAAARVMLGPFIRGGYRLILLGSTAKVPIEKGWQHVDYGKKIRPWLEHGGNVGVPLGRNRRRAAGGVKRRRRLTPYRRAILTP